MSTQKNDAAILRWTQVIGLAQGGNVPPPRRVEKTDAEWRAQLSDEQYHVARRKGTERPFSSELCSLFEPGRYNCVCCDLDTSYGMQRVETTCSVCDAHLGHVFPDGPPPSGLRFCINAVSLRKAKSPE